MITQKYSSHAIQRMFERNINIEEVLVNGEIIKGYPNDEPYPSLLKMGFVNNRPLHVLVAEN